jgi:hypothetical protein
VGLGVEQQQGVVGDSRLRPAACSLLNVKMFEGSRAKGAPAAGLINRLDHNKSWALTGHGIGPRFFGILSGERAEESERHSTYD